MRVCAVMLRFVYLYKLLQVDLVLDGMSNVQFYEQRIISLRWHPHHGDPPSPRMSQTRQLAWCLVGTRTFAREVVEKPVIVRMFGACR